MTDATNDKPAGRDPNVFCMAPSFCDSEKGHLDGCKPWPGSPNFHAKKTYEAAQRREKAAERRRNRGH